jgi:hypothetical protein
MRGSDYETDIESALMSGTEAVAGYGGNNNQIAELHDWKRVMVKANKPWVICIPRSSIKSQQVMCTLKSLICGTSYRLHDYIESRYTLQNISVRAHISPLHIANRVVKCPIPDSIKVSALMPRVEFGPWKWVSFHKVESKNTNICIALNVHPKNLETMIYVGQ